MTTIPSSFSSSSPLPSSSSSPTEPVLPSSLPTTPLKRLIFFDMDGTLIEAASKGSNHVHQDSFIHALRTVFGEKYPSAIPATAGIRDVHPQGKTDCWILSELCTLYGIPKDESEKAMPELQSLMIAYCQDHRNELQNGIRAIEGVKAVLTELKNTGDTILGLVTGNLMRIAMMKVVAGGLEGYFTCGGFGSDARDRAEMIRIGIERALQNNPTISSKDQLTIYHVGDTSFDLDAALRANVRGVGVATGYYSVDDLKLTPGNHFAIVPTLTVDIFTDQKDEISSNTTVDHTGTTGNTTV